jgi:DNA-binding CsgD family transcriptional regulator
MELQEIIRTFNGFLNQQDFGEEVPDYAGISEKIKLLERMAEVENSSIAIFDLYKKEFVSLKPTHNKEINLDLETAYQTGPAYYISLMHPDDAPTVLDTYGKMLDFSFNLPIAERKDYKTIFNFRIKGGDGKYHHFIQQVVTLELNKRGDFWLGLSIADMLPENSKFDKVQRRVLNLKTGTFFLFDGDEPDNSTGLLSGREIEILGLVAKGYLSKEIADMLFISVNTVNNHRQKILEKINAANTAEAINYARNLGFI